MTSIPSSPFIHDKLELHRLVMQWVVVTDKKGNRRPQMHWRAN